MKRVMTKHLGALSVAAVLGSVVTGTAVAQELPVDVTANIGVTSDYVWRGVSQTSNEAAVSGGIDVGHDSGLYAGFWTSSLGSAASGPENDYYAGWAPTFGDFGFDVGAIYYEFPGANDSNATEVYLGVSWMYFSAMAYSLVSTEAEGDDEDGLYLTASASFPLTDNTSFGLNVGQKSGDSYENSEGDPVLDYGATLSMGDFSLSVTSNDDDTTGTNQTATFVSWGKEFSL